MCARDGEEIRSIGMECMESRKVTEMRKYILKLERKHYNICKRYPKVCK